MHSESSTAVRVGIFFTVAVVIALGLSLQVGRGNWFNNTYELVANFRHAGGVEEGTDVTLRGVPVGTVDKIDWNADDLRVILTLKIKDKYKIPKTAVAKLQVDSLLGGSIVNIDVTKEGPDSNVMLAEGDEVKTEDTRTLDEVLTTLGDLGGEAEDLIKDLNKNQATTLAKINSVIDENREYFNQTSKSFATAGPKLEELSDRLNRITASMESGEGTIGALYADKTIYDDLREVTSSARDAAEQIKSGQGTLGTLIYGQEMADKADSLITDLQNAAREVQAAVGENREGFRELVASLSDAGPRIEEAIANLNEVSQKINSSDGTLGKLINDPSLYNDAQRTVNQVGESFESTEEQGVFRSFLGLMFGALI